MRSSLLIPIISLLFTLQTQGQSNAKPNTIQHHLILDTDLGFGPMALGLVEVSAGMEWFHRASPEKRWSLKANFGQGDIFLIPVSDSGDWNGTASVYSLEALYSRDFFRWSGKHFDADQAGYLPHSLFYETGLLGGFGDQNINTLHTWGPDVPINEPRNGVFLGLKAGVGYRYNFRNELTINFVPVALSAGYINIWSPWEYGWPRSGFELLSVRLMDVQFLIALD